MTMDRASFCLAVSILAGVASALAAGAAQAQIYQWKDESGHTVLSDKPPPGSARNARKVDVESAPVAAPAPASAAGSASTADSELAFRKRQQDAQQKAEKEQRAQAEQDQRRENCDRVRAQLQSLESGERIALRDAQGERYFLDDAQREQEIARTKQTLQSLCR
jgi:hypothetical protein